MVHHYFKGRRQVDTTNTTIVDTLEARAQREQGKPVAREITRPQAIEDAGRAQTDVTHMEDTRR